MQPPDFSDELNRLMDPYWRKARIAARLLIKREEGKPWSARDRRLAERLATDAGVTNRLLGQDHELRTREKKVWMLESWAGSINLETRAAELLRKIADALPPDRRWTSRFSAPLPFKFAWTLP